MFHFLWFPPLSQKTGVFVFLPKREDYKLIQTSLDRPEIQQIHRFIQHPKSSALDLQFILPPKAVHAKNIQKTIIFVNTMADVQLLVDIFDGPYYVSF